MRTHDWLRWFICAGLVLCEAVLVLSIFVISARQVRNGMSEPAIMTALMGVVFTFMMFNVNRSRSRGR